MVLRSLDEWIEITALDFAMYGDDAPDGAVELLAALRFQHLRDSEILDRLRGDDILPLTWDAAFTAAVGNRLGSREWLRAAVSIFGVLGLPGPERTVPFLATARVLDRKLSSEAGLPLRGAPRPPSAG